MPRRIEHQTRTNEVASRGTTKDSIIKVSDAVMARPRGNEPLKDGKSIPKVPITTCRQQRGRYLQEARHKERQ